MPLPPLSCFCVCRVISRARIKTPPLAPLTNAKRTDSDENLAELDQFVAQLRAKREMDQQLQQQQHYLAQMHANDPPIAQPAPSLAEEGLSAHDISCQDDDHADGARQYRQEADDEAAPEAESPEPTPMSPDQATANDPTSSQEDSAIGMMAVV